ncbi:MAG: phosphatidate cytidylyltransferase [Planctomycetota bacterium]|nr:MAG: phosphatidate cytidylyltransferase [Planctomycetota bacterium]REJ92693.1 MAG: phosphatidate cytidylyltransferase [Planctomycetota bacterium]REK23730.1 MAG: phosphatidate cytidylyltransferase [Planctomycetota bacterium]REK47583.1 MAG: phosphatidate cytidylyltransferase [Planctomycetota bacterium]
MHDPISWIFVGGVLAVLTATTLLGQVMNRRAESGLSPAVMATFSRRVWAWWLLMMVLAAALFVPPWVTVTIFFLLSFWALREFITLTPTRMGDHRALFWVFVLFTPAQYVLVGMGGDYYPLYSIVIPVYGFLFVPARVAFSGDPKRFLERTAKIQAGLLVCVYCLSFAPALLDLKIEDFNGDAWTDNSLLLFYFVFMVQIGDALQYAWEKLMGRTVIAPHISPNKTWEGFLGGVGSTALVGGALWWATPFNHWQAALMSLVIAVMGFAGVMCMSAVKRDRGVKDYGTLVVGHSGVLDRLDSLCFAAPVFYHLTKFFFTDFFTKLSQAAIAV